MIRTNLNQEGEEDERRNAESHRPHRGIGRGYRGCQDEVGHKRRFGQGRDVEKAGGKIRADNPLRRKQSH